jgi:hypothetical protein
MLCFVFDFVLHFVFYAYAKYEDTTITALDRQGLLYDGYKRDAGVGSGRRRQFLNPYGFASVSRDN